MNNDDQLRNALRRGVDGLEPTDDDPLATVQGVVRRRSNRRRAAAAVGSMAAIALVVVGGVAILNGRGGNSTEIATPTSTTDAVVAPNTVEVPLYSPGGAELVPGTDEFWTSFECSLVDGECLTPSGTAGYLVDAPHSETAELGGLTAYYSVTFDVMAEGVPEYVPVDGDVSVDINGVTAWYTPPEVLADQIQPGTEGVVGDIGVPALYWVSPDAVGVSISGNVLGDNIDGLLSIDDVIEFARTLEPVTVRVPYTLVERPDPVEEPEEPVDTFDGLIVGPDGIEGVASFGDPLEDVIAAFETVLGPGTRNDPGYETDGMWWGNPNDLSGYVSVHGWYDTGFQLPARSFIGVSFIGTDLPVQVKTTTGITIGSSEADLFAAYDWLGTDEWSGSPGGCIAATPYGSEGLIDDGSDDPERRYLHTRDRLMFGVRDGLVTEISVVADLTGNTGSCVRAWFGVE